MSKKKKEGLKSFIGSFLHNVKQKDLFIFAFVLLGKMIAYNDLTMVMI